MCLISHSRRVTAQLPILHPAYIHFLLHVSLPTRRSSDLAARIAWLSATPSTGLPSAPRPAPSTDATFCTLRRDRKSTRLNSSHVRISYAVFCLNKKYELYYHIMIYMITISVIDDDSTCTT